VENYGEVIWNGTMDAQHQKSQQRQASELSQELTKKRNASYPRRHPTTVSKENQQVIDMRSDWTREKQQT
jgi:hypothetical protein